MKSEWVTPMNSNVPTVRDELKLTLSTFLDLHQEIGTTSRNSQGIQRYAFVRNHLTYLSWMIPPFKVFTQQEDPLPVLVLPCNSFDDFSRITTLERLPRNHPYIELVVGYGTVEGYVSAVYHSPDQQSHPLSINIVGTQNSLVYKDQIGSSLPNLSELMVHDLMQLWTPSRIAMGERAWQAFRALLIMIFGAGRTGSVMAESLHRTGAQVIVADNDDFELHNIGESALVGLDAVGLPKAQTVAQLLQNTSPNKSPVEYVTASVHEFSSLAAVRESSLLITAVDNSAARLMTSLLASLYLIPILDLGTGIIHGDSGMRRNVFTPPDRTMGADIRLCLPDRCLLCTGGLPGLPQAAEQILAPKQESPLQGRSQPWFLQRSGSLRSLNGCAVNLGIRLLEDWLDGRLPVGHNRLIQLRFQPDGKVQLTTEDLPHRRSTQCPVCQIAGRGDGGLVRIRRVLRQLAEA